MVSMLDWRKEGNTSSQRIKLLSSELMLWWAGLGKSAWRNGTEIPIENPLEPPGRKLPGKKSPTEITGQGSSSCADWKCPNYWALCRDQTFEELYVDHPQYLPAASVSICLSLHTGWILATVGVLVGIFFNKRGWIHTVVAGRLCCHAGVKLNAANSGSHILLVLIWV